MYGLVIGILWCAFQHFVSGVALEAAFLSSLGFLWTWYLIWALLFGTIRLLFVLSYIGGGAVAGGVGGAAVGGGRVTALLGATAGAALGGVTSIIFWMKFACVQALILGGVYLMQSSGNASMTFSEFDTTRLLFGAVMLAIGIIWNRINRSQVSSNSSAGAS